MPAPRPDTPSPRTDATHRPRRRRGRGRAGRHGVRAAALTGAIAGLLAAGGAFAWGTFTSSRAQTGGALTALTLVAPTSPVTSTTGGCAALTTTWTKSATADSYDVQVRVGATGTFVAAKTGTGDVASYTDTAGRYGSSITYRVLSRDAQSGWTSSAAATAAAVSCAPATPTGVTVTNPGSSDVVTWAASTGATAYTVEVRVGAAGTWSTLTTTATGTSYTDATHYALGANVSYRVTATAGGAASAVSAIATIASWNDFRVTSVVFAGTTSHTIRITFSKAANTTGVATGMYVNGTAISLLASTEGTSGAGRLVNGRSFGGTQLVTGSLAWSSGNTVVTWTEGGLDPNLGNAVSLSSWQEGTGITAAADASVLYPSAVAPTVSGTF